MSSAFAHFFKKTSITIYTLQTKSHPQKYFKLFFIYIFSAEIFLVIFKFLSLLYVITVVFRVISAGKTRRQFSNENCPWFLYEYRKIPDKLYIVRSSRNGYHFKKHFCPIDKSVFSYEKLPTHIGSGVLWCRRFVTSEVL